MHPAFKMDSITNNRPDTSSSTHNSINTALERRRSGLLAAHGALRTQRPPDGNGAASCPVLRMPTRELSNPSLCLSDHSRAFEEQACSIPSMDLKIQTLRNLEGQEFLHSSTRSPLKPFREPSNHSRYCPSSEGPSGHSRSTITTIFMEDQEYPTSIPDAERKAHTMQGSYLHSSTNCPIPPVREPSLHSAALSSSTLTTSSVADNACFNSKQPLRAASIRSIPSLASGSFLTMPYSTQSDTDYCSEEDEDIISEEEEDEEEGADQKREPVGTIYKDITIDYPLLRSGSDASFARTNTGCVTTTGEADGKLLALKQYWADLGNRIDALEAQSIQDELSALDERLDSISLQSGTIRLCEKPASLGPGPLEKSKSRSNSSAKSAPIRSGGRKPNRPSPPATGATKKRSKSADVASAGPERRARKSATSSKSRGDKERTRKSSGRRRSKSEEEKEKELSGIDGSGCGGQLGDGSGSATSSRQRIMGESSGGSSTSTRRRLEGGSRRHLPTNSRRSSGQRPIASANDSVELNKRSRQASTRRRAKSSRDKEIKTETMDDLAHEQQRKATSRSPGNTKSPRTGLRNTRHRLSNRATPASHFGNESISAASMPVMSGDLDAPSSSKQEPKSPLEVVQDGAAKPAAPRNRLQSRMGKSLVF